MFFLIKITKANPEILSSHATLEEARDASLSFASLQTRDLKDSFLPVYSDTRSLDREENRLVIARVECDVCLVPTLCKAAGPIAQPGHAPSKKKKLKPSTSSRAKEIDLSSQLLSSPLKPEKKDDTLGLL